MQYIANVSYGKDSLAMLEIIKQHNMPLDRIVHVEIMATSTIPADLPPMMEFKHKADKIIKNRYGIDVEHIHSNITYEEQFYTKITNKARRKERVGRIYGFPMLLGPWCNSRLKVKELKKIAKKDVVQYIGIASDEPNRFHNLTERKISPLVLHGITEIECMEICKNLDLVSPIYTFSTRGGCWFCHNQRLSELKHLRKHHPEYWEIMLKWDKDSPVSFKADGVTVRDLDARFQEEELQTSMFG